MVKTIEHWMLALASAIVVLGVWPNWVMAETPLHGGGPQLTDANFRYLQRQATARAKQDRKEMEAACRSKEGWACYSLGQALIDQKHAVEDRMYRYYKEACDAGHADGCYDQGKMLMTNDVEPNADEAMLLFTKGCELGSAAACYYKSDLLNEGELVPQDIEGARSAKERGAKMVIPSGVEPGTP